MSTESAPDESRHSAEELDLERASAARVYDFWLGGSHNFAVDRELGQRIVDAAPEVPAAARANRAFLRRAVRWCQAHGINQFLDLGSGIPTVGNVHEIAQREDPTTPVAYVDNEPIAVTHSRHLLQDNPHATITHADLRDPDQVLTADGVAGLLDFTRPIAVLSLLVLQYFPDTDEVTDLLRRYRRALPAGSVLVLSHVTADDPNINVDEATRLSQHTNNPTHARDHSEIAALLDGAPLVEPGIVFAQHWHPDDRSADPEHSCVYVAVAHTTADA